MPQNKQKVICHSLTMVVVTVAIVLLGFSSVFALSLQPAIHQHNKVFDKKQQDRSSSAAHSSSSGSSDSKSSDKLNNEGNSNNDNNRNNNQGTNDGSNPGADDNLQSADTDQQQQQEQQGGRENVAPLDTSTPTPTPTPQTACEQGSNCTDQQGLSDRNRSTTNTATVTKQDDNTPFVLSLPFP
jgi:lipopolysaccharide export LptBFGC system permease protein LptF